MNTIENEEDTSEGLVYIWNGYKAITPKHFNIFRSVSIQKVSVGAKHCLFLSDYGQVYAYGNNSVGQLGIGTREDVLDEPVLLDCIGDETVVDVACGSRHSAAVTSKGDVFCWGESTAGQCGIPDQSDNVTIPTAVLFSDDTPPCGHGPPSVSDEEPVKILQISCGAEHTMALSEYGELWAWGTGIQLGLNSQNKFSAPCRVEHLVGRRVLSISCGTKHTVALVQKLTKVNSLKLKRAKDKQKKKEGKSSADSPVFNDKQMHRTRPTTCVKCSEEIYSYTETKDACIISDNHVCPLGLEVRKKPKHDFKLSTTSVKNKRRSTGDVASTNNEISINKSDSTISVPASTSDTTSIAPNTGFPRTASLHTISETVPQEQVPKSDLKDNQGNNVVENISENVELEKSEPKDGVSSDTTKSPEDVIQTSAEQVKPGQDQSQSCEISKENVQVNNTSGAEDNQTSAQSETKSWPDKSESTDRHYFTDESKDLTSNNKNANADDSSSMLNTKCDISDNDMPPQSLNSENQTASQEQMSNDSVSHPIELNLEKSSSQVVIPESVIETTFEPRLSSPVKEKRELCEQSKDSRRKSAPDDTELPGSKLTRSGSSEDSLTHSGRSLSSKSHSILDQTEAKEFLKRQMSSTESAPTEDPRTESVSNASSIENPTFQDPLNAITSSSSTIVKHVGNVLQYIPSGTQQIYSVTKWTKDAVMGTFDRFSTTATEEEVDDSGEDKISKSSDDSLEETSFSRYGSLPKSISMGAGKLCSHSKGHQRKGSLPSGAIVLERQRSLLNEDEIILDTEVWSWGGGRKGQLGHGDQLDRNTPCLINMFNNQRVVKITAGSYHTAALTAESEVYTWGYNEYGQLGHPDIVSSVSPTKIHTLSRSCLVDVALGENHIIVLSDGSSFQPEVHYSGREITVRKADIECTRSLTRLGELRKYGWIREISSGGEICCCIADKNMSGFVASLHEFASTERKFHRKLKTVSTKLLKPILALDSFKSVESSQQGVSVQMLFDAFIHLIETVIINHLHLSRVIHKKMSITDLQMVSQHDACVSVFQHYSKSYSDVVAIGGFDFLVKHCQSTLNNEKDLFEEILGEKISTTTNHWARNLKKLLQLPFTRVRDYGKLINKLALNFPSFSAEHQKISHIGGIWDNLCHKFATEQNLAESTKNFWDSSHVKLADTLRKPTRRLLRDSKTCPISLKQAGRFASHTFLLFNDAFVHVHYKYYNTPTIYDLPTIWIQPGGEDDSSGNSNGITLLTPEDTLTLIATCGSEKADWLWSISEAIDHALVSDKSTGHHTRGALTLPRNRTASHLFTKHTLYKDARYIGMWKNGKLHGKGELQWLDGRKFTGHFAEGEQEGYGVYLVPKDGGLEEIYEGEWKAGKLNGKGSIRYGNGDVYEGYFKTGKKCGHGVFKQGRITANMANIYMGEWNNDKRNGYGVFDDILQGQKYMGFWQDDYRHGNGVIITLDGMYLEGSFQFNKMTGYGLIITEDNSSYEGDFSGSQSLYGKGTMTLPNGDYIEGHFNGSFADGIKVNGTFHKCIEPLEDRRSYSHAMGLVPKSFCKLSVPAQRKWEHVFDQCCVSLGCKESSTIDTAKAWDRVAGMVSKQQAKQSSKRHSVIPPDLQKILSFQGSVLTVERYDKIKSYLSHAFELGCHPLGILMETLVDVYRATYIGVGAHHRLLRHAVEEIKTYVDRIYPIVRILFPELPENIEEPTQIYPENYTEEQWQTEEKDSSEMVTPGTLLYPMLLPKVYPPLFTLYALYNETQDEKYWKRVCHWNKQPDVGLMAYLGVDQRFWLIDESVMKDPKQRLRLVRDKSYIQPIYTLQRISTSFNPSEKLLLIQNTFEQINELVQANVSADFQWCMDDLFPVFMYVVVRGRIQHLGAEIHFIDDMMDEHLEYGELGLMFTTLKACYFQIQNEKLV